MRHPAGILVAGAGPAGLALALQVHDHGGVVRVVERRPEAFRPSRALILHARTLEVLRPLGVTEALLARADTAPTVDLRLGRRVRRISLGDLELPDTAFPHVSLVRQMDVEEVLTQALAERGVEVERGVELVGVRDGGANVRAALRSGAVTQEGRFDFVAGCDGPASTVRAQAGIGWRGRSYGVEIVLADAELDLAGGAATWRPAGTACSSPSRSASRPAGDCSRPGRPARSSCRSGSQAPRCRPPSCRSSWTGRAWARS